MTLRGKKKDKEGRSTCNTQRKVIIEKVKIISKEKEESKS